MGPMSSLLYLDVMDAESGAYQVIVESPAGGRIKFKYDEHRDLFLVHKILPAGSVFPFDFGFLPSTRAQDGDPLDVLVLLPEPAYPGCVVPARLIGVMEAEQTDPGKKPVRNDRLLAVPQVEYGPPMPRTIKDLGGEKMKEIDHFFVSYNHEEGREFKPLGSHGPRHAEKLVEEAMARFKAKS